MLCTPISHASPHAAAAAGSRLHQLATGAQDHNVPCILTSLLRGHWFSLPNSRLPRPRSSCLGPRGAVQRGVHPGLRPRGLHQPHGAAAAPHGAAFPFLVLLTQYVPPLVYKDKAMHAELSAMCRVLRTAATAVLMVQHWVEATHRVTQLVLLHVFVVLQGQLLLAPQGQALPAQLARAAAGVAAGGAGEEWRAGWARGGGVGVTRVEPGCDAGGRRRKGCMESTCGLCPASQQPS
jgi:hypothetical protein